VNPELVAIITLDQHGRGQIDSKSQLAKTLRLCNEQVERWEASGRLAFEVYQRLRILWHNH
jgi:hypothetical protein